MVIRPKLLLVGGGHAILPFLVNASHFRNLADITLINEHPYLFYSGMIPEYLGGHYTKEDVTIDLGRLCKLNGITFVSAKAQNLHIDS